MRLLMHQARAVGQYYVFGGRTLIIELVSDRIEPEFRHFTTPRQVRHTQWCGLVTLHRFAHQSSEVVLVSVSGGESDPPSNVSTGRHHGAFYGRRNPRRPSL